MDWFERITGFAEGDGTDVRARLKVDGDAIVDSGTNWRLCNMDASLAARLNCPTLTLRGEFI